MQLVVAPVEVIGLLLEDGDVDDVFVPDVLQVRERRDHFLAQQAVSAPTIRLSVLLAEGLRLGLAPGEAQAREHGQTVDEVGVVFG